MKIKITTTIIHSYKNIYINNINILYYDIIDVSEGTYINKTRASKECILVILVFFI